MNAPFAIPNSGLSSRAMLVRLSIRQWSASKTDKKITRETLESHGAADGAGRFAKRLVAKEALAKIAEIASAARSEHYARTLPWSDEGPRILSAKGFAAYQERLGAIKTAFESAVAEFVAGYPAFVEDARATLNGMFDESDYPPASDMAGRFAFDKSFSNMPDAADFRVELDSEQVDDIRRSIDADTRAAFATATRDVWQRVADTAGRMAEKLRAYQPADKVHKAQNIFRDSLVDNVKELVALLPSLNIGEDAGLAAIAKRMESELCIESAKDLRENDGARQTVAAAAETILADVSAYLA